MITASYKSLANRANESYSDFILQQDGQKLIASSKIKRWFADKFKVPTEDIDLSIISLDDILLSVTDDHGGGTQPQFKVFYFFSGATFYLVGECPNCKETCWSNPIESLVDIGRELSRFTPHMEHKCTIRL